jgi:hypothetical protein
VQLAVGFVFVLDLAAQFVEGAGQLAGRVVLVTAVDRVVGVFNQQVGLDAGVVDSREFFRWQAPKQLVSSPWVRRTSRCRSSRSMSLISWPSRLSWCRWPLP